MKTVDSVLAALGIGLLCGSVGSYAATTSGGMPIAAQPAPRPCEIRTMPCQFGSNAPVRLMPHPGSDGAPAENLLKRIEVR